MSSEDKAKTGKLIKVCEKNCQTCKYHGYLGNSQHYSSNIFCNYISFAGTSRVFKDGKLAYDPGYCDKYEQGKRTYISPKIGRMCRDEYDDYKIQKIIKKKNFFY